MVENTEVADINLDDFIDDEDNKPLSAGEFNALGGYEALKTGRENLDFGKLVITKKDKGMKGKPELTVRLEMQVNAQKPITNAPGRKASKWFSLPMKAARVSDSGLQTAFEISKAELRNVLLAFLGGKDAENPGRYPMTEAKDGTRTLIGPLEFIKNAKYAKILEGTTFNCMATKQSSHYKDRTGQQKARKNIGNDFTDFKPFKA